MPLEVLKDLCGASYAAGLFYVDEETYKTEFGDVVEPNELYVVKIRFGTIFYWGTPIEPPDLFWVKLLPTTRLDRSETAHRFQSQDEAQAVADALNHGLSVQRKIVGAMVFFALQIGLDPRPEHDAPAEIISPAQLDQRLPEADFVVTTVPHTPETEAMWNATRFRRMKRSAYFINIGRGKTASLDDLAAALENGEIAGAGLDVFETEPLPAEHPLWRMENVLVTPHIAVADAADLPERRYELIVENARRLLDGRGFLNVVDKAKWY